MSFHYRLGLGLLSFRPCSEKQLQKEGIGRQLINLAKEEVSDNRWFDFYQMHMPGIAKNQGGIGIIEWGTTLTFASLFIYFVANQLSKANLIPQKHPFAEESLHHDI